jgi:hypothetical protein
LEQKKYPKAEQEVNKLLKNRTNDREPKKKYGKGTTRNPTTKRLPHQKPKHMPLNNIKTVKSNSVPSRYH